jgi:general secretion pathway protein G
MVMGTNRLETRIGRNGARAFTLIELLLVLVILSVLAMVVVPKFTGRKEQANQAAARAALANIETALDAFEVDYGRFPESLEMLMNPPAINGTQHRPYLNKLPIDPWGNPFVYRCPGTHGNTGYDLFSMGADGREGNDDITSWQQ